MTVDLNHYLMLAGMVWAAGLGGMLIHRTPLSYIIGFFLMMQAVCLNLVSFSKYVSSDVSGHVFALIILLVTALYAGFSLLWTKGKHD